MSTTPNTVDKTPDTDYQCVCGHSMADHDTNESGCVHFYEGRCYCNLYKQESYDSWLARHEK